MSTNQITPQEMFSIIGTTMSKAIMDNQKPPIQKVKISKIELEMKMEVSSNLQQTELPSNKSLQLDGLCEKAFFKVRVSAY